MARPTTQRVVTPQDRKKKKEKIEGPSLTITLEGRAYVVRQGDISGADVMALRRATGFSFRTLWEAADKSMDLDIVAAIVWMARRSEGERDLTYEEVAEGLTYDDLDLEVEAEDDDGEARPEQ